MGRNSIEDKDSIKTINYLGLKISLFKISMLTDYFIKIITNNLTISVHGYSLTLFYYCRSNKLIFPNHQSSDLFLSDGKGFFWLLKLSGIHNIEYFSLPDLVYFLLNLANENNYSVLLFGSTKEINSKSTESIRKIYSNAIIYDGIDGYFGDDDEENIVDKIKEIKPNILFVGISSPKKELFIKKWKKELNTNIIINCGGMIDVLAGKKKLPPVIIKKSGLSWLYRVIQEPRRLFNLTLKNGFLALFILVPKTLFEIKIKRNKKFSIPKFCKID